MGSTKKRGALEEMRALDRKKLRKAVEEVVRDGNVTLDHLMHGRRLSYADQSAITSVIRMSLESLRCKPICELDPSDVVLLIAQRYGHHYVLPRALTLLERDPMACKLGDPGELLGVALHLSAEEWAVAPDLLVRFVAVIDRALAGPLADVDALEGRGQEIRAWAERYRCDVSVQFSQNTM